MLIAFLKGEYEVNAVCRIIKYVDRIYIRPRLLAPVSPLTVLRNICVEVLPDSPIAIHRVQMLCPSQVTNIEDFSHLLLQRNYFTRAATVFDIISQDQRTIAWDGLPAPIRVARNLTFQTAPMGAHTLVDISFNEPLKPGERLGFSLKFICPNQLTSPSPFRRELRLEYFLGPQDPPAPLGLIPAEREIPCLTRYAGNPTAPRVSGGFDIMVCRPPALRIAAVPIAAGAQGITYVNARGRPLRPPWANELWRLRFLTDDQEVRWRTHDFDIRLDIEISSRWPLFFLGLVANAIIALLIATFASPWLRGLVERWRTLGQ